MKMFRVVMYVKNLNGHFRDPQDLVDVIKQHKYLPFTTITEVLETDIGEWHDDHELNFLDGDYAKYFPDAEYHPEDKNMQAEYRRVKMLMLRFIEENRQNQITMMAQNETISKLLKVQEFMNSMKDALK